MLPCTLGLLVDLLLLHTSTEETPAIREAQNLSIIHYRNSFSHYVFRVSIRYSYYLRTKITKQII